MITNARDLVEELGNRYTNTIVPNICSLDNNCLREPRCQKPQGRPLLNFDKIKECVSKRQITPPSVDGLIAQNEYLCFVELKSWENVLRYQHIASKEDVRNQVESYHLMEKLQSSMSICLHESGDNEFFSKVPAAFIIVTDIDVNINGWGSFVQNIQSLSQSTSEWKTICNQVTLEYLSNCDITTLYMSCKDFDSYLSQLSHNP